MVVSGLVARAGLACWVLVVCVAVGGCGGSAGGLPTGVVAAVGSRTVSLGTLEHWARVEGKLAHMAAPGIADPAWVQPDPPSYAGCVARLEPSGERASRAMMAGLRGRCAASYRDLQHKALTYLLRLMWEEQQAAEEHIRLTQPEIEHRYRVLVGQEYTEPGELQRLLAYSGMSVADEMLRVKINALGEKLVMHLQQRLRAAAHNSASEHAVQVLEAARFARMLDETNCRAGYLVEVCRQYRGVMRVKVE